MEYKFAEVWISTRDRVLIKGALRIGDRVIPMRHDFLAELFRQAPPDEREAIPRTPLDPRRRDEKVELRAFEARTGKGGTRVVSSAAPFPLRIDEPDYWLELQDWGI